MNDHIHRTTEDKVVNIERDRETKTLERQNTGRTLEKRK